VKDFRELDVWCRAHELVLDVYKTTDSLPKNEVFGLTIQLRRAAMAIAMQISEGCGTDGDIELARCLQKAKGSSSELEYLLLLAKDLNYLDEVLHARLSERVITVRKMLVGFVRRL
jgi:four helix bundle protein